MMGAQESLKSHSCWIIGKGDRVNIWSEPWVHTLPGFRVTINNEAATSYTWVNELLLPSTYSWNTKLLRHVFPAAEVSAITRLRPSGEEDRLSWLATSSGSFKCSSFYKQLTLNQPSSSATSVPDAEFQQWSSFWKLKCIAPRVHLFVWKSLRGALSVAAKLSKYTPISSTCSRCGVENETISHCLLHCRLASEVWMLAEPRLGGHPHLLSVSSWVSSLLDQPDKDPLRLAAAILWSIWKSRNDWVFNRKEVSAETTYHLALRYFEEFNTLPCSEDSVPVEALEPNPSSILSTWTLPVRGIIKINVDGAFKGCQGAAGAIARDHRGTFLGCMTKYIEFSSALLSEAIGFELGLQLAERLHLQHASIEGDSATVVSYISSAHMTDWRIQQEIRSCKYLLSRNTGFNVVYIPRNCNTVAHDLASFALDHEVSEYWGGGTPPAHILDSLFADLANCNI